MLSDTRKNRTLSTCLVVGMLVLIWGNSLLTADISSAISRFVGTLLGGGRQMAESSQGHHLLRKPFPGIHRPGLFSDLAAESRQTEPEPSAAVGSAGGLRG